MSMEKYLLWAIECEAALKRKGLRPPYWQFPGQWDRFYQDRALPIDFERGADVYLARLPDISLEGAIAGQVWARREQERKAARRRRRKDT